MVVLELQEEWVSLRLSDTHNILHLDYLDELTFERLMDTHSWFKLESRIYSKMIKGNYE